MRKVRCPICEKKKMFKDRDYLITHINKCHKDSIPDGWDAGRYENFLRTGKEHGTCVYCKSETRWNPDSKKYYRMCGSAACKKKAADIAEANMKKKTGMTKSERMSQPDVQTKMIYAKHTSGCYKAGGHDILYDSSYVKDFLMNVLDAFLGYDMSDVYGPSLNTYRYKYDGKEHTYIPDLLLLSLGLEVEIKDGGDNPNMHPKIQAVDKVKEAEKDKVMFDLQSKGKLRYIKIVNKDYTEFFKLLLELKDQYDSDNIVKKNANTDIQPLEEGIIDVAADAIAGIDYMVTTGRELKYQSDVVRGKIAGYRQIVDYYYKAIRSARDMKSYNELEWQIQHTFDALKEKKEYQKKNGGVEYDLEITVKEIENGVFRELQIKKDYLIKKAERSNK